MFSINYSFLQQGNNFFAESSVAKQKSIGTGLNRMKKNAEHRFGGKQQLVNTIIPLKSVFSLTVH